MHEMSFIKSLLSQVDDLLIESGALKATQIRIEIGPLSGVEIELVRSAYERLSLGSPFEATPLMIDEVPLVIRCLDCSAETKLVEFIFCCGKCASCRVKIIRGDEFILKSVTIEGSGEETDESDALDNFCTVREGGDRG